MTCTIHYSLKTKAPTVSVAKDRLESLRQRALALPFEAVSELYDLEQDDLPSETPHALSKVAFFASLDMENIDCTLTKLERTLAFIVSVGEGCESAVIGLRKWERRDTDGFEIRP